MNVTIQSDLAALNRDLRRYSDLSGKTPEDVMLKQGTKLSFYLSNRLRKFTPARGIITGERTAALKRGEGVRIRPSVRASIYARYSARTSIATRQVVFGKKGQTLNKDGLNLAALMVRRELAVRESGRGFVAYATRLRGIKPQTRQVFTDRYNRYLASVGFRRQRNAASLAFAWGGSKGSNEVAKVLQEPRAQQEIAGAIRETSADIRKYVDRKVRENAKRVFR